MAMKVGRRCRRNYGLHCALVVLCLVASYALVELFIDRSSDRSSGSPEYKSFTEALSARADMDGYIVLAMVDEAFTDMAANLYETSLRPLHIDNFLLVGVGNSSCDVVRRRQPLATCFHYSDDASAATASSYGRPDFIRKMNIRTEMILDALAANFTVIHTDLDVAFLHNPLTHIKSVMKGADVAALWDNSVYNAGFVVVRPSARTVRLYEMVRNITTKSPKTDDQQALNRAIRTLTKERGSEFKATVLDKQRYLSGVGYFERSRRWFPNEKYSCDPHSKKCRPVLVVHNNWIVSKEAKIYRFREHLMWMYDGDDEYYSSKVRKYLTYSNPQPDVEKTNLSLTEQTRTRDSELQSLQTALAVGFLLDRVVILPRFHAGSKAVEHPLNAIIHIKTFDDWFSGLYRESSFLRHPKVPGAITDKIASRKLDSAVRVLQSSDILRLFGSLSDAVLKLENLSDVRVAFSDEAVEQALAAKLSAAFRLSDYRQLHPSKLVWVPPKR